MSVTSYQNNSAGYGTIRNTKYSATNNSLLKNVGLEDSLNTNSLLKPSILEIDSSLSQVFELPLDALLNPSGIECIVTTTGGLGCIFRYIGLTGETETDMAERIQNTLGITTLNSSIVAKISFLKTPAPNFTIGVDPASYTTSFTFSPSTTLFASPEGGFAYLIIKATNITPGSEAILTTIKKLNLK